MRQISLFILLTVVACSCHTGRPLTPKEQERSAVKIESECGGLGSGVLIGPDRVLTAYHVVDCGDAVKVTRGDRMIGGLVVKRDQIMDIAELKLSHKFDNVITPMRGPRPKLDTRVCFEPEVGGEVRECGWVLKHYPICASGDIYFSAFTWFGNSGSGLWDERGRLVGIVVQLRYGKNLQVIGGAATSLQNRKLE